MAQYRQSGFDRLAGRGHDVPYGNGTSSSDHVAIGVRNSHKQSHRTRRPGQKSGCGAGRKISVCTVAVVLSLAITALVYVYISGDYKEVNSRDSILDDDFKRDFLSNVSRINMSEVQFGGGSGAHGRDSRYWDGDDRRRDDDYNEEDVLDKSHKDKPASEGKTFSKISSGSVRRSIDRHGLYNEAGRNELKMYEEKYEASLRDGGLKGAKNKNGNQFPGKGKPDRDKEGIDVDDEYDDGIDLPDARADEYDDNRHDASETGESRDLYHDGSIRNMMEEVEEASTRASQNESMSSHGSDNLKEKSKHANNGDGHLTKSTGRKRKRRKFSSSCHLKFLDSAAQLVEPLESRMPKILVQLMSSLCCVENGSSLKSMGLRWLCTWLNELYTLLSSSGKTMEQLDSELDLITTLKKLPFIPLSDGTHSSLNEGTIWLSADFVGTGFDCDERRKFFPNLYATLRIVSPHLFPAASDNTFCSHSSLMNNVKMMLHWIGVQNLTAHDIIKAHILPSISDEKRANQQKCLFIEYTVYVMLHLQSSCPDCLVEKESVIAEFRDKALIFTNYGFKLLKEVPIHFGREFGNSLVASQFVNDMDYKWHEIDLAYLKHPIFESMPCGLQKLREFFLNLGITDFVKVSRTEKHISEVSPSVLQQVTLDSSLISSNILFEDWESEELACILSSLTRNRNLEKSKYLLEVIDRLWDTYFTEKSTSYISSKCGGNNITFRSSFMNNICTVRWVASSTDDMLHYPSELFHDCDAVSSVFGDSAAYAVPKIKSRTLLIDIGLKTQVTIDDALATLKRWIKVEAPFKASISQMSRLYMFISTELASSREKIINSLCSDKFIFVPCTSGNNWKDIVPGFFLSPQDVYWEDSTGVLNSTENPKSSIKADLPMNMLLGRLYPGLRDFFVHECGVAATPPFRCYLQILKQLSDDALPLEAASTVFQVLLLWSDGLERGDMDRDDIAFLRSNLLQVEFSVLPAFRDKWVSLHPSYGLVCWSDDDTLKKQFKHLDNIEFLYFGELSNDEKEVLQTKVSRLLKELGIPSISEVVTREAICYGPRDSRVEASLVAWALPFAQRYIRNVHPKKYDEIKQLGFEKLQNLKVVVVERLFYRNVIRNFSVSSKKRLECSSLLQDTTLYTTRESNSHAMFMELSRLFFNGDPELHLANFLHMLTTMVESGSTEQQLDFFILNSQNMPKPPDEPLWSISLPSAEENDLTQLPMEESSSNDADQDPTKQKKRPGITYWPPSDWKTAPKYNYSRVRTQPVNNIATEPSEPGSNLKINVDETSEELGKPVGDLIISPESGEDIIIIEENVETLPASFTEDPMISTTIGASGGKIKGEEPQSSSDPFGTPINLVLETHCPTEGTPKDKSSKISQAITIGGQQAMLTGKMGEAIAFEYFKEKHGNSVVKWVNEENETGLPYDLIVGGENERTVEFVEVKATRYAKKNWFAISIREWQLALEKGDGFTIAHVVMSNPNAAKITVYRDPAKLCQQGKLQLALMSPRQYTS